MDPLLIAVLLPRARLLPTMVFDQGESSGLWLATLRCIADGKCTALEPTRGYDLFLDDATTATTIYYRTSASIVHDD
jgi:hypothetical protein